MSMKIQIQDALNAKQSCDKLLKNSFKAKVIFKLLQLQKELNEIEKNFNETRDGTVKKYAAKDDNGEPIVETLEDGKTFVSVLPEYRIECTKEIAEILTQEVEIAEIYFNVEDFGESLIVGEELSGLLPFILD